MDQDKEKLFDLKEFEGVLLIEVDYCLVVFQLSVTNPDAEAQ